MGIGTTGGLNKRIILQSNAIIKYQGIVITTKLLGNGIATR